MRLIRARQPHLAQSPAAPAVGRALHPGFRRAVAHALDGAIGQPDAAVGGKVRRDGNRVGGAEAAAERSPVHAGVGAAMERAKPRGKNGLVGGIGRRDRQAETVEEIADRAKCIGLPALSAVDRFVQRQPLAKDGEDRLIGGVVGRDGQGAGQAGAGERGDRLPGRPGVGGAIDGAAVWPRGEEQGQQRRRAGVGGGCRRRAHMAEVGVIRRALRPRKQDVPRLAAVAAALQILRRCGVESEIAGVARRGIDAVDVQRIACAHWPLRFPDASDGRRRWNRTRI